MTVDPNQLRRNAEYIEQSGNMTVRDHQAVRDYRSVADALDVRDKRIAELEAALVVLNDTWINRAEKTEAAVKMLAKALNFYGDPGYYRAPYTAPGGPLYMDCGMTARQALNDPTVKRILEDMQ